MLLTAWNDDVFSSGVLCFVLLEFYSLSDILRQRLVLMPASFDARWFCAFGALGPLSEAVCHGVGEVAMTLRSACSQHLEQLVP